MLARLAILLLVFIVLGGGLPLLAAPPEPGPEPQAEVGLCRAMIEGGKV